MAAPTGSRSERRSKKDRIIKKSRRNKIAMWVMGAVVLIALALTAVAALNISGIMKQANDTDAPAQAHAAQVRDSVQARLDAGREAESADRVAIETTEAPLPSPDEAEAGEEFGLISSPWFGTQPVAKSFVDSAQETQALIDTGVVAAYDSRENPGEIGNFVVTGHRITHGSVFNQAVYLSIGDEVKVETSEGTFTYEVIQEAYRTNPDDNSMLDSNPLGKEANVDRALMTLITCGEWMTDHREIIVLELVESEESEESEGSGNVEG
ncbi:sortase domain-bontaining protein [Citricoccus nitrophenolicus]|uniref:sortase domain-containing protein n=1 Tax=Citricoccus nitrophenolicus TaxID=863575 RepID=UPI0031EAA30B